MHLSTLKTVAGDIKLAHSVFALPFALLGAVMAAAWPAEPLDWPILAGKLLLIVLAMVFARSAAMIANRLLDAQLDAKNPRTASRAIPGGRLSLGQARAAWLVVVAGFLLVCTSFGVLYGNWWPAGLGVPVVLWISLYGLAKRFTVWCHIWLGSSLAMSPLAAALAIAPASLASPALWFLSAMVLCWVAGFDIIYALQDVEVDARDGLHSMPSRLGVARALLVAQVLHVLAVAALVGVALTEARLEVVMLVTAGLVGALLVWEHATVKRWGTTKIALTFFTINGVVSLAVGAAGIAGIAMVSL